MVKKQMNNLLLPRIKRDCILSEGLKLENLEKTGERSVVEISPCASERGKIMAEIDLSEDSCGPFLDVKVLCLLLKSYQNRFAEMKCSQRLGVGRLMWKTYRIYVYKNGKFKIRFAHNREDAIRRLDSIGRLILSSIICKKCGRPAVECILNECNSCVSSKSPQIIQLNERFNSPLLIRGLNSLKEAFERGRELTQEPPSKERSRPNSIENSVKRKLREAIEYSMNFSLETPDWRDSVIGVELIALARENLLLVDQGRELLESICSVAPKEIERTAVDLIRILWQSNENLVKGLDEKNREERKTTDEKILKSLRTLNEIRNALKDKRGNRSLERTLEKLEKRIQNTRGFLNKIRT